jgi:hypothetical protein
MEEYNVSISEKRGGVILDFLQPSYNPTTTAINASKLANIRLAYIMVGRANFSQIYGDALTWEHLALAGLNWGTAHIILFNELKKGWMYVYKCVENRFIVWNEKNEIVYSIITTNISDFGITWDIFCSHQFRIDFIGDAVNIWFLIGQKKAKHRPPPVDPDNPDPDNPDPDNPDPDNPNYWKTLFGPIRAMYCDQYYTNELHHELRHLASTPELITWAFYNEISQEISYIQESPNIIRSNSPARSIRGDFEIHSVVIDKCFNGSVPHKERKGNITIEPYITFLLALLSASLYNRGKPVYEPWMLWWMWKWIGSASPVNVVDVIFDIMPNWGA